jgi:hypothetical protein
MSEPAISSPGPRRGELLDPGGGRRPRRGGRLAERARRDVDRPANIRLWLPLTPLWIVLAPFALLLAPLLTLVPPMLPNNPHARAIRSAATVHPYRAAFALGSVLFALSGLVVHVDTPDAPIHIRIV